MVQSTNCIIILVPIPSLPKPPFLTALISCKHSCRFSPLRNTGYPMRKLTIHCGNRSPIKRQGKLPLTQHNITPLPYKTQLTEAEAWYAPHIHKSFHSHIFTSLKMSIPKTKLLREKIFNITTNSLLYSVAHALYKTNTETSNLTTLRRSYLKYCKL